MELKQLYRALRAQHPKWTAAQAVQAARAAQASGKGYYGPSGAYNPRNTDSRGKLTEERWIEDTERAGLRFVGFADELLSLRHTGWFTHPDGDPDETYRGAVWQLPGRDGCAVYVAGYADPNNDGAAYIDFEPIYGEEGGATGSIGRDDGAQNTAARAADSLAERNAEREREYQDKWQAARRVEDNREAIGNARDLFRDMVTELRQLRATVEAARYPILCKQVRADMADLRRQVAKRVTTIRETLEQYGDEILSM